MVAVFQSYGADGFEFMNQAEGDDFEVVGRIIRREIPIWHWSTVRYVMEEQDDEGRKFQQSDAPSVCLPELVLRPQAVMKMLPLLQESGCDLVPLQCAGASVMLVAPPRVDAVDEERSDIVRMPTNPDIARIRDYVFKSEAIRPLAVFKVTTRGIPNTYVTDAFVTQWKRAGLQGLGFRELWRG